MVVVDAWLDRAARTLTGGHEDRCEAGHRSHAIRTIDVHLEGRPVPDCPAPPVALSFWFSVFDADCYQEPAYCTGDDELSRAVLAQGGWEAWETALATAILTARPSGESLVVDLGSHVGWYSILAAVCGYRVLAVDADTEHLALLHMSANLNDVTHQVTAVRGWIDATKPPLPGGISVRFCKIDLENAERFAVQMLGPLLETGAIDYLLMELSPEFGHDWLSAVGDLALAGYHGFVVPTKGDDLDAYEADPLAMTLTRPLKVEQVDRQMSVLFLR